MRRSFVILVCVALVASLSFAGVAAAVGPDPKAATIPPTVLIASGLVFPDALSAAALSAAYEAPILLTQKDVLPSEVAAEIQRSGATRAIILGGEASVGASVERSLRSIGKIQTVERIAGRNRFIVSAGVAQRASQAFREARDARVQEVRAIITDQIAAFQGQLDGLAVRLGVAEDNITALDGRVGIVEADVGALGGRVETLEQGGNGAGPDDFWPELTISVEPVLLGASDNVYLGPDGEETGRGRSIHTELRVRVTTPDGHVLSSRGDRIVDIQVGGHHQVDYYGELFQSWYWQDGAWVSNNDPPTPMPEPGDPIRFEYWVEAYGQRVHGVEIITDWEWTEVVHPW